MAEVNFLEMSDEDLLRAPAPVLTPVEEVVVEQEEAPPVVEAEVEVEEELEEQVDLDEDEQLSEEEQAAAASLLANDDADLGEPPVAVEKVTAKPKETKPAEDKAAATVEKELVVAEAQTADDFQKLILAPFKANGRDMQVKSAEEAVTLMQQGAGYNKKMADLKPKLAILKQLEQHDLMSDEKIGFLIDLSKKNPEAIGKLLKDSGIDPLDLDTAKVDGYKPGTYAPTDAQMNLDTVLEDLRGNESFEPVIQAVANEWDAASQKMIGERPDVLRLLTKHKEMGAYDLITTEVARRTALGQLRGIPTLKAYDEVGRELEAAGAFDGLAAKPSKELPPVKKTVAAKPAKPAESQAVIDKRKAAASTATATAKKAGVEADFNPLAMSDEDFAKFKPDFL